MIRAQTITTPPQLRARCTSSPAAATGGTGSHTRIKTPRSRCLPKAREQPEQPLHRGRGISRDSDARTCASARS